MQKDRGFWKKTRSFMWIFRYVPKWSWFVVDIFSKWYLEQEIFQYDRAESCVLAKRGHITPRRLQILALICLRYLHRIQHNQISGQNLCLSIGNQIFLAPADHNDQRILRKRQLADPFAAPWMQVVD